MTLLQTQTHGSVMSRPRSDNENDNENLALSSNEQVRRHAIELRSMSRLMIVFTMLTSFSGFMFGYDTGYISGALVVVGTDLGDPLTSKDKELITSATSLGALISALCAGTLADLFGRKKTITGANIFFIAGAIMQVAAHSLWVMIGGRFVMGLGVGIASLLAPLYISEIAPSRFRGQLIVVNVMTLTFGQLVAYAIGAGLTHVDNGWRIMVGLSMVPSVIQMSLFMFMPESPRFLVMRHRNDEARYVLSRTYKSVTEEDLDAKIQDLAKSVRETNPSDGSWLQRNWKNLKELHTIPSNFRALVIICGLQGIQQFSGWNSLMYFSATVFESVGFDNPTAVSIIISGTNFVFTGVAFMIIEKVGRRKLLLSTIWGMSLGLALNAIAFHFLPDNNQMDDGKIGGWAIVIIFSMLLFAAFYATGIGCIPWCQGELLCRSNVRAIGTSFATATNWTGSLIVSATFLTMLENITPTGTFAFYAGLCAVGEAFVYFLYPETAGLSLEEVQELLDGGFNIKKSVEMSKQVKAFYADHARQQSAAAAALAAAPLHASEFEMETMKHD